MSPASTPVRDPASLSTDPAAMDAFYQRADALYRSAVECCRQHERLCHLMELGALPTELRITHHVVLVCDEALGEMAAAYEKAAGRAHPAAGDECWQKANTLWMASREYARRCQTTDRASRGIGDRGDHSTARLGELALDYDLEASSLLQLRQATDAYRKIRPHAA